MSESQVSPPNSQSLKRLKKYGLKDKTPTVSTESVVAEKKDKLECCKTNTLIGRYIGLFLWIFICFGTFFGIYYGVYGRSGFIASRSKLTFDEDSQCPNSHQSIPWYRYYDQDGIVHCYWFAATTRVEKSDWWHAREQCKNLKANLNDGEFGNTGSIGAKIKDSYLFIPETGDEFHRVARHLATLEEHKILSQRPNMTFHGDAEFWIGGRKCLYDYPKGGPLHFHDYLWVPKNQERGEVPKENVFCQVGQIHHVYTNSNKIIRNENGDVTKTFSLSGECWNVMEERPQQRMSLLDRPFNVWTNKYAVEDYNPLHKRILEMEESHLLTSFRHYFKEPEADKAAKVCDYEGYGFDNEDIQKSPFCMNLATYADPTKNDSSYSRDEESEWTWYSYPCHWNSLYICEAEMETEASVIEANKLEFHNNKKVMLNYWSKNKPRNLL